jgi:hypothetical protein
MHLVWEQGFWPVVRCGNLLLQIMIDKLITMACIEIRSNNRKTDQKMADRKKNRMHKDRIYLKQTKRWQIETRSARE